MITSAVPLGTLPTGIRGLDEVLGGGLPELSFNLIAGPPGSGKTTCALQIAFANATPERPALFFTVLGEPTIKLLRYQQQMSFFDARRLGKDVQVLNLSEEVLKGDLGTVLERIIQEVEAIRPGIVVIDSFRTMINNSAGEVSGIERFVQQLGIKLTTWEVTSFLVGEYQGVEQHSPVFTVADGVLWMSQALDQNSSVRKLQVVKMRGRSTMPGLHTMRISADGIQVFPRTVAHARDIGPPLPRPRLSTGIPGLDALMDGGVPAGDAMVLAGATGTGKTTFARMFAAEGCKGDGAVVMVVFEEHLRDYLARSQDGGAAFVALQESDRLRLIYLRPLDLSPDEVLYEVLQAVDEIGATRVVVDSLSGFEVALAPTFRSDFRESIYRFVSALTARSITVLLTLETQSDGIHVQVTGREGAFLCDDIVVQRQVEIAGEIRKVMAVVKMRGSLHSHQIWEYEITGDGIVLGKALRDYDSLLRGTPHLTGSPEGR